MPEAVNKFISTNDMQKTRKVLCRLLDTYKADFGVHLDDYNQLYIDDNERSKLLDVFNSLPKQLAKENKKFQYNLVDKKAKARTHEDYLKWLCNYGLIDISCNLSTIQMPFDFFVKKINLKSIFLI